MQITCIGHAGLYIETRYGTILCDPWLNPAYFDSWFVFPDNSALDWDTYGQADYLYVSHLHKDHYDPQNLTEHVSRDATVLLPDYPVPDLRSELERLGFTNFLVMKNNEVTERGGLRLMVQALDSPADGPLGDSILAVDDGTARVLNQNDARPMDMDALRAFGQYDVHFLQYSGAIWWPWTYELPEAAQLSFGETKRANGLDRATRFVKAIGARYIVPSAGPACFLDDELFAFNDLDRDPANTFPDQTVFLDYLRDHGFDGGRLMVPGAVLEVAADRCEVRWPGTEQEAMEPFLNKKAYLQRYAARMAGRMEADKRGWAAPEIDVFAELKAWFEPLLELAAHIRAGVGCPVLLSLDDAAPNLTQIVIDFPAGEVRRYAGETCRYQFTIARALVERLIADHEKDWVNSLFLSMRFRARRVGQYNEYIYTFFKCLAPDRLMYAERWYAEKSNDEEDIELGQWLLQRRCPHLGGDLSRFGEISGTTLTCTVHGWQFDLPSGRCLNSDSDRYRLRCSPSPAEKVGPRG